MSEIFWVLNRFNGNEKIPMIENPTIQEYEAFLLNTKYKAIRGISVDNNLYVTDAQVETHDDMYNDLKRLGKANGKLEASFDECLNGSLTIRGPHTDKIKALFGKKMEYNRPIKFDYFDIERLFDEVCIAGDKNVANGLNGRYSQYNIDFNDFLPSHKYNRRSLDEVKNLIDDLIK